MEDIEEPLEDEDIVDDEDGEDLEPPEDALTEPPAVAADPAAEVASIEDLLVKKESVVPEEEEEEEDALLALTREERLEALDTRVVPIQAAEFVCKKCYLVKHRSQLKDKKRMLCRDCA
ncbi:MAG: DUF4193 family protein [Actinobacteria bacterium]|nr:DUF4193 family protein [Actinomycetota bacterium]